MPSIAIKKATVSCGLFALQFVDQAVERFNGAKGNRQFAGLVHFAMPLGLFFDANFHLRGQPI